MFPFDPPLSPIFSENIKSPLIFWCFQGGGGAKGNIGKESVTKELGRSQKHHIQGYFRETSFLNSSWFYMNTSNVDKEIIY